MSRLLHSLGKSHLTQHNSPLQSCIKPDEFALADALKASLALKSVSISKQIHGLVVKLGYLRFTILMTALMDFKLKCGSLEDAQKLFDEFYLRDVVSWTSIIVGYARKEHYPESLKLFQRMVESETVPNKHSFSGALTACSGLHALKQGKQIHAKLIVCGELGDDMILQNSLLNMYSKCGSLIPARKLFDLMPRRGNIAWNELIWGYLQGGQSEEALKLLGSMICQGVKPDDFSYAISANACASFASICQGIQIHACIIKSGFELDLVVGNSLIDMYAKCGCINSAKLVFSFMLTKDTKLWTTVISAFGKCGLVQEVFAMFKEMLDLNIRPDEVTYLAVLSACNHGGLAEQGWHYFRCMTEEDMIPAKPEHYACMVDLLCRCGYLIQALEFISEMKFKPSISVWTAFLNSCRQFGKMELAQFAARKLTELDPENHSNCVVLSNMYAAEGNWEGTETVRERMKTTNMKKEPGCSWIEVKNGVHVFITSNNSHPEMREVLWTLNRLTECLKGKSVLNILQNI